MVIENGHRRAPWQVGFVMEQTLGHRATRRRWAGASIRTMSWKRTGQTWSSIPRVCRGRCLGVEQLERARQPEGAEPAAAGAGPAVRCAVHPYDHHQPVRRALRGPRTRRCFPPTPRRRTTTRSAPGTATRNAAAPDRVLKRRLRARVFRKAAGDHHLVPLGRSLARRRLRSRSRAHPRHRAGRRDRHVPLRAQRRHVNGNGRPVKLLFVGGDFHRKGGEVLSEGASRRTSRADGASPGDAGRRAAGRRRVRLPRRQLELASNCFRFIATRTSSCCPHLATASQ